MHIIAGAIIVAGIVAVAPMSAMAATTDPVTGSAASRLERGRTLAFDRGKGNCLACHEIAGGTLPGNIGPPLVAMKLRFPDKPALRAQVSDAGARNPDSIMPPFGRHRILTDDEIDLIVEFLYTL